MHHPIDRITHTTAFVTPVMEHWLEQRKLNGLIERLASLMATLAVRLLGVTL